MAQAPFQREMTGREAMAAMNALAAELDRLRAHVASLAGAVQRRGGGPAITETVKLDAVATGGGIYAATQYVGDANIDPTVDLALPGSLQANAADSPCYVVCPDEEGRHTHQAEIGQYTEGFLIGYSAYRGGASKPVYLAPWAKPRTDSPYTMLANASTSELTAQTDTWDRTTSTAGGVIYSGPRIAYDTTASKFWQFARTVKRDASGREWYIGVETKTLIIDLVNCTTV